MTAGVKRETVERLLARHGVAAPAANQVCRMLDALATEVDPPTTVATPSRALDAHVADSLSGLEVGALRAASTVCDLGSGAGFPGLPLAIAMPAARVDLVESTARKCAVIERLAAAAEIGNVRAIPSRAEDWAASEGALAYDAVSVRAVAALPVLCEYAAPLLRLGGVLVAWKGRVEADEAAAGARAAATVGLEPDGVLSVEPFAGAHSRTLHVLVKVIDTPSRYPRRPGVAARRPLG